jgi:hypothetical protein
MSAGCGGCERRWTGLTECHCARCHAHFGGITAFDRHLSPSGCRSPGSVRTRHDQPAFLATQRAHGTVWVRPGRDRWATREELPGC